jgi:hypothetical protein
MDRLDERDPVSAAHLALARYVGGPGQFPEGNRCMVTGTRLRELLIEVAELRQRAKLTCERTQMLRQDHRFIIEAARSQSRLLIAASRQLARPNCHSGETAT